MPRDDGYDPKKHFSPKAQEQLNREEIEELIDRAVKKGVEKAFREHGLDNPYEKPAIEPHFRKEPEPYTEKETAERIVKAFVDSARFWINSPTAGTIEDRCEGVAFSCLAALDGTSLSQPYLPPVKMFIDAGNEYIDEQIDAGERYFAPHVVVDKMLHDMFYTVMREHYGEDAGGVRGKVMHPDQMREKLSEAIYNIAQYHGTSQEDKLEACHHTARNIVALLDGENSSDLPPFMLMPAPSREFDQRCVALQQPIWKTNMPINRKAPQYGIEDSLLDAYDTYRNRANQAKRDLFK